MKATRVYVVDINGRNEPRLVRATFGHIAERHVIGKLVTSRIASKDDLIDLMSHGVRVEDAEGDDGPAITLRDAESGNTGDKTFADLGPLV